MVRRWLLPLMLSLLSAGEAISASPYRLWTSAPDGTDLELGRATGIWLNYRGPADLDKLVVTPWEHEVAIRRGYTRRDGDVQRLRLRLTPRRAGTLTLPPLQLGGAVSEPLLISVQLPHIAGVALEPNWRVSPTEGWQYQERIAQLSITVPPGVTLRPVVTPPVGEGIAVATLPPTHQGTGDGGTRYAYHWLLRPRLSGEQPLTPAGLKLMQDGVPRWDFHFPHLPLSARPIPSYVTPTVPVGRLSGGMDGTPVLATGPSGSQLQAALQQAHLDADIATDATPTGTQSEIRIRGGWGDGDAGIVYFDTDTGRLRNLEPTSPPLALLPVVALTFMLVGIGLWWARHSLLDRWHWWRYWAHLRTCARTPRTLKAAICTLPLPDTGAPPRSLAAWREAIASRRPALAAIAQDLEAACFGVRAWDVHQQQALRGALGKRRRPAR